MRREYEVKIRWNDVDTYGHVNNVAMLGLVQEARTSFLRDIAWFAGGTHASDGALVIIAYQAIEYREQMPYGVEPVTIRVWFQRVGGADVDLGYQLMSADGEHCYAVAMNTVVFVDPLTNRPRRLLAQERTLAKQALEAPVAFRRR